MVPVRGGSRRGLLLDVICSDCGSREAHKRGDGYCRPCAEKNGHGYAFRAVVDLDQLEMWLGVRPEAVEELIKSCQID